MTRCVIIIALVIESTSVYYTNKPRVDAFKQNVEEKNKQKTLHY